jgi:hypothetical protein
MKESGKKDKHSEKGNSFILMVISMMANGQITKQMVLGATLM